MAKSALHYQPLGLGALVTFSSLVILVTVVIPLPWTHLFFVREILLYLYLLSEASNVSYVVLSDSYV